MAEGEFEVFLGSGCEDVVECDIRDMEPISAEWESSEEEDCTYDLESDFFVFWLSKEEGKPYYYKETVDKKEEDWGKR